MPTKSYWLKSATLPKFDRLKRDIEVDVAVIGGGIAGATAAYLLKRAGRRVALLERDRCGRVDTGHTTAHLTYVTDQRLRQLVRTFGRDHAQAAWDAGQAAIEQIRRNVEDEKIDCEFRFVPGYVHASLTKPTRSDMKTLQRETEIATELGFDATFVDEVPGVERPGVAFANQALFHPLKYLAKLLQKIDGKGSHVFERSEAKEITDEPLAVKCNGKTVRCGYVIIATHVPLMGKTGLVRATLFQSKIFPYTSYVVGARIPCGQIPEASYYDTSDPYYYLRIDPRGSHDYAIFGGEDHKTGQETDPESRFAALEKVFRSIVPEARIDARWSGQVIETSDGLPYMGETADRQFVATGFGGNGMTFGTLGAMMAADAALGRKNPWRELFDVHRKKIRGGAWNYITENADYPYYMVKDRLAKTEGKSTRSVSRGEGKILRLNGKRIAVYRDDKGKVTQLSPVCTHMGCLVNWNQSERTWDCPCHGSRFHPTGEVLAGPAEEPLPHAE